MEDISVAANIYLITNYTDYPRSIIVQEDKTFFFSIFPLTYSRLYTRIIHCGSCSLI